MTGMGYLSEGRSFPTPVVVRYAAAASPTGPAIRLPKTAPVKPAATEPATAPNATPVATPESCASPSRVTAKPPLAHMANYNRTSGQNQRDVIRLCRRDIGAAVPPDNGERIIHRDDAPHDDRRSTHKGIGTQLMPDLRNRNRNQHKTIKSQSTRCDIHDDCHVGAKVGWTGTPRKCEYGTENDWSKDWDNDLNDKPVPVHSPSSPHPMIAYSLGLNKSNPSRYQAR